MSETDMKVFDFEFDAGLDELAASQQDEDMSELFLDNEEGRTEFLPPDAENIPVIENAVKQDSTEYAKRPAEERTRELFSQMKAQKSILMGIVDFARTPCTTDQLEQRGDQLREARFSVYTTSNICAMMEIAGALERVTEDGQPYATVEIEPNIVTIDGEEYYEPSTPPAIHWRSTAAGLAMLDDDCSERIDALFEDEAEFLPIYKRVLTMAAADEGTTMDDLSAAVDENPLIAKPRRYYVQHFTEFLENRNAVAWQGSVWKTTDTGTAALEKLADVADDYTAPVRTEDMARSAAESDGINW